MKMTAGDAGELEKELRLIAQDIREEMKPLERTRKPCETCGLLHQVDRDEYQWGLELDAVSHKLERIAASIRGRIKERANVPERSKDK